MFTVLVAGIYLQIHPSVSLEMQYCLSPAETTLLFTSLPHV
jgi:hypothetical protein